MRPDLARKVFRPYCLGVMTLFEAYFCFELILYNSRVYTLFWCTKQPFNVVVFN